MSSLDPRKSKYQRQFRPLLNRCKDMVLVYVSALLTELFANSDKALMSFAQKAETNEVQNRFFEAMAIIRNRRGLVEHEFREQLSEGFDHFWESSNSHSGGLGMGSDIELELVDRDAMDQTTALENMVAKTISEHRTELYALSQRLSVVYGGNEVKSKRIPAGPYQLTIAFNDAIDGLGLESRIRIIVLALFNKYVLKQLGSLYEDYNNNLKEAGVLPHLRPTVRKSESAASQPKAKQESQADDAPQTSQELGEELFGSILDLMSNRRHAGPPHSTLGSADDRKARPKGELPSDSIYHNYASAATPADRQGPPVAKENIVSALNEIQPEAHGDYLPDLQSATPFIPNVELDEQFLDRIKQTLIEERHKLYNQVDRNQLDTVDEDTIDLVGMLFEYMLNDPVLPAVAKALISHLHTPYLKVAIIDRSLLTDSNHDARLLLDSLVEAGSHWIDEHNLKRGIYPAMQDVVDTVLKEFTDNIGLFSEQLNSFRLEMDNFRKKTEVLEKRAQDSAKGREKLTIARQRASQEMKARTFNASLPQVAKDFLVQTWTDKLIFILLRHPDGELSEDWKEALRVADELTWAFEPKSSQSEMSDLENSLPNLRDSIQEGLESLGDIHQEKSKALFELLATPESAIAAGAAVLAEPPSKAALPHTASEPVEITGTSADIEEAEAEQQGAEIPQDELDMMEKLRKVEYGTWFELDDPTSGENKRVKLSWLSPLTGSCMFVDRAGVQTAIKPLRTLAQEVIAGKSRMLEESNDPFVDRTLHAIRRMLQRSLQATEDLASELLEEDSSEPESELQFPLK